MMTPSNSTADSYRELIGCLPLSSVEYAFAYGSGALQQKDEDKSQKMVDFILSTNDPPRFHAENIAANPGHYSTMRYLGPKLISQFQCGLGARVYYNTHVRVGNRLIKYGIISTENLKQDLLDWRWIYVAGRLHKPVLELIKPSPEISDNLLENRRSALQAALILLPDSFTLAQLFHTIVSLSYTGDFRMMIGEDKNKVNKIVEGSYEEIHGIYKSLLDDDGRLSITGEKVVQDASSTAIYHRLNLLPSTVLNRLQKNWNKRNNRQKDTEEVLFSLAHRHDVASNVASAMSSIVAPVALSQTGKNALSAGITRSIIYSMAKLSKMLRSRGL